MKTELERRQRHIDAGKASAGVSRIRKHGPPVYMKQLVDKVGIEQAADLIGFSKSGIHTSLSRDKVSITAEVAARGALAELGDTVGDRPVPANEDQPYKLMMVSVPAEKYLPLTTILEAMGISHKDLDISWLR